MKRILNSKAALAGLVFLITFVVYLSSLQNDFVGFDDSLYVFDNPYIRSLNVDLFRWAFLSFYAYNWHPLTWVSHAMDYAIWGLNPMGHHLTSIIIHSLNTTLVVFLIIWLMEAAKKDTPRVQMAFPDNRTVLVASGVTGFLFGLHPLHVESVAWVAERKDLLCALFFLLSMAMYIKHALQAENDAAKNNPFSRYFKKYYLFSLGFFILALLSKPMAVTLPIVLVILDWYPFKRIHSFKTFMTAIGGKIPFIALSFSSSVLTVLAQSSGNAIWEAVPLPVRVLVALKSIIAYLWKMLLPLNLMPFYPHPREISFLSAPYISAAALVILITLACIVVSRERKVWLSIWCYYIATLLPVLGIVQVGGQSMADRYTYLPSLGPFLILGLAVAYISNGINRAKGHRLILKASGSFVAVLLLVSMSFITVKQIGIWKNSIKLWTYVIEKEPKRVLLAYYYRGITFAKMGKYDKAIDDYNKVISWNYKEYSKTYVSRGLAYNATGQTELALADFKKACELGDGFGCKLARYFINHRTFPSDEANKGRSHKPF